MRVPVATVVRVGAEVVLVTALLLVALAVRDQACMPVGRSAMAATRRWACAPAVVDAKPACCGPGCRGDLGKAASHYDKKYFEWQTGQGLAKAQGTNFNSVFQTRPTDVVGDLGAGGGHILATLNVSGRVAIEINPHARALMSVAYPDAAIHAVPYIEDVADDSLDLLYSTSVIEHLECPLTELRAAAAKVKVGGRIIVGIKNEGVQVGRVWTDPAKDIDMHLYTWAPQMLANLLYSAGFRVDRVDPPAAVAERASTTWTASDRASYKAFVYHWAFATKVAADAGAV